MASRNPDINYPLDDIRNWVMDNNVDKIINKTEFRKKFNAQGTRSFTSLMKQFDRIATVNEDHSKLHKKEIKFEWREEVQARDTSAYKDNSNAQGSREDSLVRLYEYLILERFNSQSELNSIDGMKLQNHGCDTKDQYARRFNAVVNIKGRDNFMTTNALAGIYFDIEDNPTDTHKKSMLRRGIAQLEKKGYISIERKYHCKLSVREFNEDTKLWEYYHSDVNTSSYNEVPEEVYNDYVAIRTEIFDKLKENGKFEFPYKNWSTLLKNGTKEDKDKYLDMVAEGMLKYSNIYIINKEEDEIIGEYVIRSVYEKCRYTLKRYADIKFDRQEIFRLANIIGYMGTSKKIMAFQSDDFHKSQVAYINRKELNRKTGKWEYDFSKLADISTRKNKRIELMNKYLYDKYNLPDLGIGEKIEEEVKFNPFKPVIIQVPKRAKKTYQSEDNFDK